MEEPQTPASEEPQPAAIEPKAPVEEPAARRKRAVLGLLAAIVIGAAATGIATYAERYTGWVARVDGQAIRKPDFDRVYAATRAQYQQRYNVDFASPQALQIETDMKSGLMNQLIEQELIRQEAAKRGIQVADADVEAKLAEIKKAFPSEAVLAEKLKANGLDLTSFKTQIRDQLEVERVVRDVTKEGGVPDPDVRKYYDQHRELYNKQEEVHARHVLVKDEVVAKMVAAKLKAGGDFKELAKQYSEDEGSKGAGGDLGYFVRGRMVKEFEQAAFTTPVGLVTPLVKTRFGYHIIKVEDKRAPRVQPFSEVQAEIRGNLESERRRGAFGAWLDQRKQAAKLEFKPGYKPLPKIGGGGPGEDGGHGHGAGDGH